MLVDQDPARAAILEQALLDEGYQVVARVPAGGDLLDEVRRASPDMIIIDMELPDRDTLESLSSINRDQPKPIVMFAENSEYKACPVLRSVPFTWKSTHACAAW